MISESADRQFFAEYRDAQAILDLHGLHRVDTFFMYVGSKLGQIRYS